MQCSEVTLHEVLEPYATIQDLPHELLADIISIVAVAASDTALSTRWMPLRLVCRDWNALACSTASLWKDIRAYPKVPIEWLLLCLERSGQAPLDILFHELPQETLERLLPVLSRPHNAHRIRIFRLDWTIVCPPLLALFRYAMPSLETLDVCVADWPTYPGHYYGHFLPMSFSPMLYPQLHTLKLIGMPFPKNPAIYAHLQSLALNSECCRYHRLSFADLVAILRSTHRLETLDLSGITLGNTSTSELRNAAASIDLPYLRTYIIQNTTLFISSVNRLISFPMSCAVKIVVGDGIKWTYESSHAAISDIMGPCIRRMLEIENATAMTVSSDDGRFYVSIPADSEGTCASPRVEVRIGRDPTDIPWAAFPLFGDFVPFCPSDRLTHLTFSSVWGTYPAPRWAAVLRAYPTLQSITITHAGCDVSRMISALTPLGPGHPEDRQELLCPALRSIHVTLYTRTNKVLYSIARSLVACATARAERGARPLESFTAIQWTTSRNMKKPILPENPDLENVVERLRALIDQVDISASPILSRHTRGAFKLNLYNGPNTIS